jgi:MscS family membrane protein
VLKLFHVDLSAILSGLGIGGFAVAFAAKDTIANFFGSVSILMGDLFEQGDWIEVDGYEGTVVEIGLRATTIRTFDNAMIALPNFKLADNGLKNWSKRQLGRRIKMHIGVTYESDFNDIKKAVSEIREMLIEHKGIANNSQESLHSERYARLVSKEDFKGIKRTILVYMDEFSDSSIDILVYCYSKSVMWNEWLEVKEDVMYKMAEILEKNNLSFAYPALAIHQVKSKEEM